MRGLRTTALAAVVIWLLCTGQALGAGVRPSLAPARVPVIPTHAAAPGLGLLPAPVPGFHIPAGFSYSPVGRTYSSSFDLRTLGKVTPVKNQNPYGTCWAFASIASLESGLLTGETWDFSEDNLAYFHGFDWTYDEGGNSLLAASYLTRWTGPFTEAQDPYNDSVHPDPSTLTLQKHVQDIVYLPPRTSPTDNDDFKYALTTWGAVDVSIFWDNASYNSGTHSYRYTGSAGYNHDVTMVGWDDDYLATNFSPAAPGNGAFLIKNSWGTGWGNAGYFWISYYDSELGYDTLDNGNLQASVFMGAQPTTNYTHNYQWDPFGYVGSFGYGSGVATWGANRFVAQASEQLKALGFWTLGVDTSYQLYYGTSLSSLQLEGSGTLTDAGFHTVALDAPVDLTSGSAFYVAVKLTTPGYAWPMADEQRVSGYDSAASASANQSFYSASGTTWSDLTTYSATANICLKAYTGPSAAVPPVVTAPNGGENWAVGSSRSITWTPGSGSTVAIALSRDDGSTWQTLFASTANDGAESWTVGGATTTQALVRITGGGADTSDAVFSVVPALTGTMSLDGGDAYVTSPTVTVDSAVAGVTDMRVRDSGGSWSSWGPYAASMAWVLPAGDGAKTVDAEYRDTDGNVLALQDAITLDTLPPDTAVSTVPSRASGWYGRDVTITLTPHDAGAGMSGGPALTAYSTDGGLTWTPGSSLTVAADTATHALDGPHAVEYYSIDALGHTETAKTLTVNLDTVRPTTKAPAAATSGAARWRASSTASGTWPRAPAA